MTYCVGVCTLDSCKIHRRGSWPYHWASQWQRYDHTIESVSDRCMTKPVGLSVTEVWPHHWASQWQRYDHTTGPVCDKSMTTPLGQSVTVVWPHQWASQWQRYDHATQPVSDRGMTLPLGLSETVMSVVVRRRWGDTADAEIKLTWAENSELCLEVRT